MNNLTWLDLYNFLNSHANDIKNLEKLNWSNPVVIHDAETGDEYSCDTYFISTDNNEEKLVLTINTQAIYN